MKAAFYLKFEPEDFYIYLKDKLKVMKDYKDKVKPEYRQKLEELGAWEKWCVNYEKETDKLFPQTCTECNGTSISRASSKREDDGNQGDGNNGKGYKPNHEVIMARKNRNLSTSIIHGK